MKYIILELDHGNGLVREIPVIFGEALVHAVVSESIINGTMREDSNIERMRPVAAGFLSCIELGNVNCHGKSESLKLESRGQEDVDLMKLHDYTHGLI